MVFSLLIARCAARCRAALIRAKDDAIVTACKPAQEKRVSQSSNIK
jgi:hypothetical protein